MECGTIWDVLRVAGTVVCLLAMVAIVGIVVAFTVDYFRRVKVGEL